MKRKLLQCHMLMSTEQADLLPQGFLNDVCHC